MIRRSRTKLTDYEPKRRNPITLGDDSNIDKDLKVIKVDNKNSILELSENELKVRGTIDASAITVDGASVQTGTGAGATQLDELSDVTYSSGDLTITSLDTIVTSGDLLLDVGGDIELNADGADITLKDGVVTIAKFTKSLTGVSLFYNIADVNDYFKIDVGVNGATTLSTTDADTTSGHLILDADGKIVLDSHTGVFIAQKAGTEFSAANSAYAGMILGYTDIGLDEADATYNLTTSYAVPTSEFSVTFVAPPSGNVEIYIQIQFDTGSAGAGDLYAGLSDNATYSRIEDFHEVEIKDGGGRFAVETVVHSWTLTGLTAGTSYERWVGFKSSSTMGTPNIKYGSNASGEYPDFIMKAIALPATITT